MVLHEATQLRERSGAASKSVVRLDAQTTAVCTSKTTNGPLWYMYASAFSLQYLTAIAVQLLKLGGSNEDTLTSQGLCRYVHGCR